MARRLYSPRYFITLIFLLANARADIPSFFAIDTFGCESLIRGDYRQALQSLESEKAIADSGFWNFKKGVAYFNKKDYSKALSCLVGTIRTDSLLAPAAYEYIGDIASAKKRIKDALEAYMRGWNNPLLQPDHANALQKKIRVLLNGNPALIDSLPFLNVWRADSAAITKEKEPPPPGSDALDSLVSCANARSLDSVLAWFIDSAAAGDRCAILARIEGLHLPDSVITTKRMFGFSQIGLQCKVYEKALGWLAKAMERPDFRGTISAGTVLYHLAMLEYYCAHYTAALPLLLQYKNRYGPKSEIVLAVARTYRTLGQDSQSLESYALFTRLYPRDPLAGNVLWHLAAEHDQQGHYHKAIALYRRVLALKKNPSRAAESLLRIGLCHYKAREYAQACSSFSRCQASYPDAAAAISCLYWKAHSCLAREDRENARKQFVAIVKMAPTNYYAYRAREALTLSGDTAMIPPFDTIRDDGYSRQWLDSISSTTKEIMARADSFSFEQGKKLAFAGCRQAAEYYLEPLETRYPSNLRLQYDLAIIYKTINNPTASFRVGRRLAWRIPVKYRSAIPLNVHMLMYPFAFFDKVKQAAIADTVDPFLVLGIIRQESVFNPTVVSRAGAIGLMQLMPATAREVATELSEPFVADSLTRLAVNIRYGTHYLKKLLDQFHGNMIQAIAGYNGGPPAIMRWFEKNKSKSFDLFIEDIGYEETRGYVKRVLANYWTYRNFAHILGL